MSIGVTFPAGSAFTYVVPEPGDVMTQSLTDYLVALAAKTLAPAAAGTNGQVLTLVSGLPAWRTPSGGSAAPETLYVSWVDRFGWFAPVTGTGNFTTGIAVNFQKVVTITGIRVYWPGGGTARTVRLSLWDTVDNGGTRLRFIDVATSASAIYSGTFSTPYVMPAGSVNINPTSGSANPANQRHWLTAYDLAGVKYATTNTTLATGEPLNFSPFTIPQLVSPSMVLVANDQWTNGDARPTTGTAERYMFIEPIFG